MKIVIGVVILVVILAIFANLPTIVVSTAGVMQSSFFQYIRAAMYFLPIVTVVRILACVFTLWTIKVLIGLGITLKEMFSL